MSRPSDCRVLVVEDNPADAIRVRRAFDERGGGAFRTTFVGRISEALPRLRDADMVLLDLSLPDGRGVDSVDRVLRKAPGVPLVVLSGNRDEEMAFRCLQHGALDVLLKGSLDGDALVRAVRCALDRQALAADREAALAGAREGEGNLRAVLEAAREGILVADPDGRTLLVNPAGEALLGWMPGSGGGRPAGIPLEVPGPVEVERRGYDGEDRTLEVRASRIPWRSGRAVLATIHDATPRGSAEAPRGEGASGEREAEWLGALGRLAGGVAHEINNQLTVILGYSSRVLEESARGSLHADARIIEGAGWRAAAVVDQLMAFAGRQAAAPEILDLNDLLDRSRDRIERGLPPGVSARWRVHPGALKVSADRRLLEQALLILVEHAEDSMPGGGFLTVSTVRIPRFPPRKGKGKGRRKEEAVDPRARVVLAVSDTGPGLSAEARIHLFDPFYTTEVLGIGSGLGMAPVLGIARQSGGETAVESAWGRGTTVRFILPAVEDDGPGGGGRPLASRAEPPDLLRPGSETLVLVEEDDLCRSMLAGTLRAAGYAVIAARNAGDAVRAASSFEGPLPLLVAEARSPGIRGPMLARVLRCRDPRLRALLLADPGDVADAGSLAGQEVSFLGKPFAQADLVQEIRRILDSPAPPLPLPGPGPAVHPVGAG